MPYCDLARVEYHRHIGNLQLPGQCAMRASTVEYHAPARFDDLLEVFVINPADRRPLPVPDSFRDHVAAFEG